MLSQSFRCVARMRLLSMAPQSSRSISASSIVSAKRPFRGNLRGVREKRAMTIDELVQPRTLPQPTTTSTVDSEWLEGVDAGSVNMFLEEFMRRPHIRELAEQNYLTDNLFMKTYQSFRKMCEDLPNLDPALIITFRDIIKDDTKDVKELFPFFLNHAKRIFPHLESMDELRNISDLTQPHNWYPEARMVQRKIIFHAGPTNSGKTFGALQRFRESKSGVFCGPLKLLAAEVFTKLTGEDFKVDMVTGEERRYAIDNLHPSPHISCTVEMLSTAMRVEVAVIDEIQMLRDEQRGWAWTRALLGVAADEVHLCGEVAAIPMVKKLLEPMGETVEVREYERKSPLAVAERGLGNLNEVKPADCIVCFSKKTIFETTKKLEMLGITPAVIYGDLPPGTKLAQAAKFNDGTCDVLVATDAIGMGLNLNIRRIIFASTKRMSNPLPTYAALQIAGRAGRYGTAHEGGVVTTLRLSDISKLKEILSNPVEPIDKVGIAPTFDQIETFSFHLPQASFVRLLDIFVSVCSISDHFFICTVEQMKTLATAIDHIPLGLKPRYTFCICPINIDDNKFAEAAFVKMARRFSSGNPLNAQWIFEIVGWPPKPVEKLADLVHLENVYEILDAYLWMSLRFPDMFHDEEIVREGSKTVDNLIREGVENLKKLLVAGGKQGSLNAKRAGQAKSAREAKELEKGEDEEEEEEVEVEDEKEEKTTTTTAHPSKQKGDFTTRAVDRVRARGLISEKDVEMLKQGAREDEEEEEKEEKTKTPVASKRNGNSKSVVDRMIERGRLSKEEAAKMRQEILEEAGVKTKQRAEDEEVNLIRERVEILEDAKEGSLNKTREMKTKSAKEAKELVEGGEEEEERSVLSEADADRLEQEIRDNAGVKTEGDDDKVEENEEKEEEKEEKTKTPMAQPSKRYSKYVQGLREKDYLSEAEADKLEQEILDNSGVKTKQRAEDEVDVKA